MASKRRAAIAGLAALAVAALAGWLAFSAHQEKERSRAVVAAIEDTTARMRQTLSVVPTLEAKPQLAALEKHAAALDAHLATARRAVAAERTPLAVGAEHYILSAREILRRQVTGIRQAEETAASRAALAAHMRRASRRDTGWIREATSRKKRVESEYFDYNLTLEALVELLYGLPAARKRLAPHVEERLLLEIGAADDARRRTARAARRIAEELDDVRRYGLR